MSSKFRIFFCATAWLGSLAHLDAQKRTTYDLDPQKPISQYTHEVWQTENGLPQSSINAIVQSKDGYLWMATQEGLVRFDGVHFDIFDKENTPVFRQNYITAVVEDQAHALWIGTSGGGLLRFRDGEFISYGLREGLPNELVRALACRRDGTLWIGTTGGGISVYRNGQFITYTKREGLADERVNAIYEDTEGNLWIGTNDGISRFSDGKFTNYSTKQGLGSNIVNVITGSSDGSIWFGTYGGGLSRWKNNKFKNYTTRNGLSSDVVIALLEDLDGTLWIGTNGGGLNRLLIRGGVFSSYSMANGLSSDRVASLFQDREGSLWVGTDGGGLNRFKEEEFTAFTREQGLSNNMVWTVTESRDGSIWLGTHAGGLNKFKNGMFEVYTTKQGLPNDVVRSVFEDAQRNLWIGTYGGGVSVLSEGRFHTFDEKNGLSNNMVRTITQTRDRSIWIGTNGGLDRLKNGKFKVYNKQNGLSNDLVRSLIETRDGSLWIGTNDGLNRLKDGKLNVYTTKDGLPFNVIFGFHESSDGSLWFGTQGGGLGRFKDEVFHGYSTKQGLFDDLIFQVLEDSEGRLWMSCNRGIFTVERKALDDFDRGVLKSLAYKLYDKSDGMASAECNGGSSPAGWKARDGRLWFPTIKGAVVVDPALAKKNEIVPPVLVRQVMINKRAPDTTGGIEVPVGDGELEFHYTGLSFLAPEKVRFRYELEGFDKEWIEAGKRRIAYYTNISPGRYKFRVQACNNDGVWNATGASLSIYLKPYFYQTWWFFILVALAISASALGGFRLRVRQLRVREGILVKLVEERTKNLVEEKRRTEEALLEAEVVRDELARSEAEFRALIQNSSDVIVILEEDGRIRYQSPSMTRIFGHRIEVLFGRDFFAYVHRDDIASMKAAINAPPSHDYPSTRVEFRFLHGDGSHRHVEGTVSNLLGHPRIGGIVLNVRDITERKKSDQALRESEERYRRFFEEDLTGDFISTPDGKLIACNPQFAKIYGFKSVEEAMAVDLRKLYPTYKHRDDFIDLIKEKKKLEYFEEEVRTVDGKQGFVIENVIGIFDERGELVAIKGYLFDNTRLKLLEEQLRQAQKLKGIGEMAAGVAHNFNNILSIILGYAMRLKDGSIDSDRLRQSVDVIETSVQRGAALVAQLLTFARLTDVKMESVDMNIAVKEISAMVAETFPKTITVIVDLDENIPVVSADYKQLSQAFLNLCVNARDAMPSGGELRLRTRTVDGSTMRSRFPEAKMDCYVSLSVCDTGEGIADDVKPRIFEPFFTTKGIGRGTGLGLSVVYGIVNSHGGFVEVESRLGVGTTVHSYFPAAGAKKVVDS